MEINRCKIKTDKEYALKFAMVSDLHGCDNAPVISAIKNENIDAVLVAGDFIHSNGNYERGLQFLRLAAEIAPTFCCIGNHENRFEGDLLSLIARTGAVCLNNKSTELEGVCIGGLTSVSGKELIEKTDVPDLEWLLAFSRAEGFKILLCHHPEYFDKYICELPIDLTVSGHAHGGQWRFFGRGVFAPGQGLLPKYTSGLYKNRLLVGRGLGNPHIIPRINNKPEIIIFEI